MAYYGCDNNLDLLADAACFVYSMDNMSCLQRKRTSDRKPRASLPKSSLFFMPSKIKRCSKRKSVSVKEDKDINTTKKQEKNATTTKVDDPRSDSTLPTRSPSQEVLALVNANEGSDLNFLIRKQIYKSDINPHLGRLSIPCRQVKYHGFLTTEEEKMATGKDDKGVMISLISPSLDTIPAMSFRKWKMNNTSVYVICGAWSSVIKKEILKEGDYIELWSFRNNTGTLCLAMIKENQNNSTGMTNSQSKSDITIENPSE